MIMKRINTAFFAAALIATIAPSCHGQYTTDWLANTFGTNAARVGNVARSMWVAPEGVVYTASMWDENEGGIAIYQNGQSTGSMGAHGELQGGTISGNATSIFAALQFNTAYGSGSVGRYNRTTHTRDLIISVSATKTERRADVITGIATFGTLLYASDLPGNRVRCSRPMAFGSRILTSQALVHSLWTVQEIFGSRKRARERSSNSVRPARH